MPSGSGIKMLGNWSAIAQMNLVAEVQLEEELEESLEKSAIELRDLMRRGIARKEFGLAANTELTKMLKGGSDIPLYASGQLHQNITVSKIPSGQIEIKGEMNDQEAYFVGVKRFTGTRRPSNKDGRMGKYTPISVFNIARKQVEGYTVTLPKTGVRKKVPKRDFVTPAVKKHKKRHEELMESATAVAVKKMGRVLFV